MAPTPRCSHFTRATSSSFRFGTRPAARRPTAQAATWRQTRSAGAATYSTSIARTTRTARTTTIGAARCLRPRTGSRSRSAPARRASTNRRRGASSGWRLALLPHREDLLARGHGHALVDHAEVLLHVVDELVRALAADPLGGVTVRAVGVHSRVAHVGLPAIRSRWRRDCRPGSVEPPPR